MKMFHILDMSDVERDPIGARFAAGYYLVSGGSRLVSALEAVYRCLRASCPELPDVVVTTGTGRLPRGLLWGSHCADRWQATATDGRGDGAMPDLFISGECIAQGGAFTWLVVTHEAAHALGAVRGIKNCSGQGNRYHNRAFLELATELGCWYPLTEVHPSRGYTDVELTEVTLTRYASEIADLDLALALSIAPPSGVTGGGDGGVLPPRRGTSDRNNPKFICDCDPPRIMRMSVKTWEQGAPWCTLCDSEFA